jgi:2-aminoadipate transaminase
MLVLLDRKSATPLYAQIVEGVRRLIASGALGPGARLPAARQLARELGINRNTANNAYDELVAEGLLERYVGQGTYVAREIGAGAEAQELRGETGAAGAVWTDALRRQTGWSRDPGFEELVALCTEPASFPFSSGLPPHEFYPVDEFRRATNAALREHGQEILEFGNTAGYRPFLEQLRRRLADLGIGAGPGEVMTSCGTQEGLDLLSEVVLEPGDSVVLGVPTYPGALRVFRLRQAKCIGVPVDEEGMRPDLLARSLAAQRPKFIYVMPTFHNPTGAVMSLERRREILALSRRYRVPILEDHVSGELYYESPPPAPLKALDDDGLVAHLSSFSKILFPGLRLGWLVAPEDLIERMKQAKGARDLHTNTMAQGAMHEFCRRGHLKSHLAHIRQIYGERRDAMLQALDEHFPPEARWTRPSGGLYLWVTLPSNVDVTRLFFDAREAGVLFAPGPIFCSDGSGSNAFRLGFSLLSPEMIREGIGRLGKIVGERVARRSRGMRKGKIRSDVSVV